MIRDDTHEEHVEREEIMSGCSDCLRELEEALGPEARKKVEDATPDILARVNKSLLRDDVQPFEHVRSLGGELPKVWHRFFAGDFMASTHVRKVGAKTRHRLTATAEGMEEALENL